MSMVIVRRRYPVINVLLVKRAITVFVPVLVEVLSLWLGSSVPSSHSN